MNVHIKIYEFIVQHEHIIKKIISKNKNSLKNLMIEWMIFILWINSQIRGFKNAIKMRLWMIINQETLNMSNVLNFAPDITTFIIKV